MASLRDVRRKIKSVSSTRQIMRTMKMVSAARIRKAQTAILSSRPFALKMEQTMRDLEWEMSENDLQSSWAQPLFTGNPGAKALGLILVSSDKGLCGAFNTNVFREALAWLKPREKQKIFAAAIGRKARDFLRRLKMPGLHVVHEMVGVFPRITYVHAELLGRGVIRHYGRNNLGGVTVIYNEFKSMLSQKAVARELLPLIRAEASARENDNPGLFQDFMFEPDKKRLFEALVPRYVKAEIYRILLESQAAELAARMNAMEAASNNADEILEALTLLLNRTRQASITKELSEIVSGAEALAN